MLPLMWRAPVTAGVIWIVGAAVLRATLAAPEACPPLTAAEARSGALAAAEWIVRHQQPDGTYVYEYNRDTDTFSRDYNIVRHAGVTMSLYQLVAAGEPRYLEPADRGLAYMQANLVQANGGLAFASQADDAGLGSSALMLAGLAQRRIGTGESRHDALMHDLARFILGQQRADGSMLAFWSASTRAPVPELTSKYYTGEAFWALGQMHNLFPGEGYEAPARLTAGYLSTRRDEAEGYRFPPWPDQWAAYGLAEMRDWGLDDENIAYARSLAARFGVLVRAETGLGESLSAWLVRAPEARAAGLGVWVEGLTSLWRLADSDPRMGDIRDRIGDRAICSAGLLYSRQVTAEAAARGDRPGLLEGAWFTGGVTRMDDQQHALSGLLYAAHILEERE
jgi:hypothetical protein